MRLAKNAAWLLTHKKLVLSRGELQRRYYNLLLQRGYAHYSGKVKTSRLTREFNEYFPKEALEILGCTLRDPPPNWASRLLQKDLIDILHHPIHHLLVLDFLGISLEEFFISFSEFKPFGDPPYSCLNAASSHYGKLTITSCKIFDNLTKGAKYRGPLGVFSCKCGFIYQRKGPDSTESDRLRYDSVREYGPQWESSLTKQWQNLNISLSQIARNFNTTTCLITRHAIRLKLPMNQEGARPAVGYSRYQKPRKLHAAKIEKYRAEWLEILKKDPKASRKILLGKANFLYLWLQRNDTEWFNPTLPVHGKIWPKGDYLNWNGIDEVLCQEVSLTCDQIKNESGHPIRISISEILKRVDCKKWIDKRHTKLPLTAAIIDKETETLEDFMIRKIRWATEEFIRERKIPTRLQLEVRAAVRNRTSEYSKKIQEIINVSMNKIRRAVSKVAK